MGGRRLGGMFFKSTTDLQYENYRSASWDSSAISKGDLQKLREPLKKKRGSGDAENPYEAEKQEKAKKSTEQRKSLKAIKEKETKELKREVEALTQAVGYKGDVKSKAQEVIRLNSKAPSSKKDRKKEQ